MKSRKSKSNRESTTFKCQQDLMMETRNRKKTGIGFNNHISDESSHVTWTPGVNHLIIQLAAFDVVP